MQALLPEQRSKHETARQCVLENAQFFRALVGAAVEDGPEQGLTAITRHPGGDNLVTPHHAAPVDTDKVRCEHSHRLILGCGCRAVAMYKETPISKVREIPHVRFARSPGYPSLQKAFLKLVCRDITM